MWWIETWGVWFFISFILAKVSPYIILPLFFKFTPLDEGNLKEAIEKIASYFGIAVKRVEVVDFSRKTHKANAFVTGLGRHKRIALADNLLSRYTDEEVQAVIAHEFAHIRNRDTLFSFMLIGVGSLLMFFFLHVVVNNIFRSSDCEIHNIAGLPVFFFFAQLFMFMWMPIQNVFLRRREHAADRGALTALDTEQPFISLMEKLSQDNLAERTPPFWKKILFYSHPPIDERIKFAQSRQWQREGNI